MREFCCRLNSWVSKDSEKHEFFWVLVAARLSCSNPGTTNQDAKLLLSSKESGKAPRSEITEF